MKTVDFSETISASDLKVGRYWSTFVTGFSIGNQLPGNAI